jgi:DNA replication protein DnaC
MALSDAQSAALTAATKANREKHGVVNQPETQKIPVRQVMRAIPPKPISDEAVNTRRSEKAASEKQVKCESLVNAVRAAIGKRYSGCTLANYDCTTDEQSDVVTRISEYADALDGGKAPVSSIVLYGPVGTGKDHLLSALMLTAARNGHSVHWTNGMDLYSRYRDSIDSERTEKQVASEFTTPDVLCISDPIPPWGELTTGQVAFMFRVLDRRYRDMKPTWCSMNAASSEDAADRMSSQLIDRLKDGAICLHCNWPSHRKSR